MSSSPKIGLVKYGVVNIAAIERALIDSGADVRILRDGEDISTNDDVLVLPGVGSWEQGVSDLKSLGLFLKIQEFVEKGKKVFGICLGFQLMARNSEEGTSEGLNFIPANVKPVSSIDSSIRSVNNQWSKIASGFSNQSVPEIADGISNSKFYFTHRFGLEYVPSLETREVREIYTIGNSRVVAFYLAQNFGGVQFHPERSHKYGTLFFSGIWKSW